jgi:hypothetical protein
MPSSYTPPPQGALSQLVEQIADAPPQIYTNMRNTSTNSTTEVNLATVTLAQTNNTVVNICGHVSASSTGTFWVRIGSTTGKIVATGTTTSTTVARIGGGFVQPQGLQNMVLYWDASNSVGGTTTTVIDGPASSSNMSYVVQGRWIFYNSATQAPDTHTLFPPPNLLTNLYLLVANVAAANSYHYVSNNGEQAAASTETLVIFSSINSKGDYVYFCQPLGGASGQGSAVAYSAAGLIVTPIQI